MTLPPRITASVDVDIDKPDPVTPREQTPVLGYSMARVTIVSRRNLYSLVEVSRRVRLRKMEISEAYPEKVDLGFDYFADFSVTAIVVASSTVPLW